MSDLYYYRARYYDPHAQRFISMDPIEFESGDFNHYRYVGNDPVNFLDPSGLDAKMCETLKVACAKNETADPYRQNFKDAKIGKKMSRSDMNKMYKNSKQFKHMISEGRKMHMSGQQLIRSLSDIDKKAFAAGLDNVSNVAGLAAGSLATTGIGTPEAAVLGGISVISKGLYYCLDDNDAVSNSVEVARDTMIDTMTPPTFPGMVVGELIKTTVNSQ